MKRRVLVTGATGHLGSHLVRRLVHAGDEVAVLVRRGSHTWRIADLLPGLTVLDGGLESISSAAMAIRRFAPEIVFHLGWFGVTGAERDDRRQISHNLLGSLELFQAVSHSCHSWVGLGSQAEYGPSECPVDEWTRATPTTLYGEAKLSVGSILTTLGSVAGLPRVVWLRLLAAYGPADDPRRLIPSVITTLLNGGRPELTPGEQRWDYLYVADAVDALLAVADSPNANGVYVLASGTAPRVRTIVETIRDLIDPRLELDFGARAYPDGRTMHLEGVIERLRTATGWHPETSLAEGLQKTVDWYRDHPDPAR